MKLKHVFFFIAASAAIIVSCSKDDEPKETINETGGEVFRSQVVTIDAGNSILDANEYDATFNGQTIKLLKTDESKLSFMVPYTTPLGNHDLIITSLNSTIHYNVNDVVLPGSPEETIQPLLSGMNAFKLTLDETQESADVKSTLSSFNEYYENATDEEKKQMAVLYTSNKILFDAILLNNTGNPSDRLSPNDIALITVHGASVLLASSGAVVALVGPTGPDRVLGAVVAVVAFAKCIQTHSVLARKNLDTIELICKEISEGTDRSANSQELVLQHDTVTTFNLQLVERQLTGAGSSTAKGEVAQFYKDSDKYNYYAGKVNNIIIILNNIPFVNIKSIPLEKLPENVQSVNTDVDQAAFNDIKFSIDHSNLSLVSATLLNNGQLNIKIKIIGSPATLPVTSTLKYEYKDDYTTFSGGFPIIVEKETNPLIGNWKMVTFGEENTPIGTYVYTYYPNCPEIWSYKESASGTMTFTSSGFSYVWNNSIIMPHFVFNPETCEVFADNPDTENIDTETGGGTYQLNGVTYKLIYTEGGEQENVIFITPDRIRIYHEEYIRVN